METLQARYDSRKSFYGKAIVMHEDNRTELYSYDTLVCTLEDGIISLNNLDLHSSTTRRHVREFVKQYGTTNQLETVNRIYKEESVSHY